MALPFSKLSVCYREKTLNILEIVNSLDEDRPTSHRENRPSHLTPSKTSGTILDYLAFGWDVIFTVFMEIA